ncbi:MAG: TRAP transporter small permease [Clostridia bacterium]|nr:TRAP transporter small permease [Clostridia bacterium]
MNALKKIDTFIYKMEESILAFSIMGMSLILVSNVTARLVFDSSLIFAEEIGRYLIVLVTFMGMSYVARIDKHVKVSAFYDHSSLKVKKIIALLISSFTSITLFWLCYIAYRYMLSTIASGRVSPALGIPVYLITGLVCLGIFFTAIQYLVIFILNIKEKDIYIGRFKQHE